MGTTSTRTVSLFSYGTLQDKDVQLACFSRELSGRKDALPGYVLREAPPYLNAEPSPNPEDEAPGIVFEITEAELAAADKYEEDADYRRISVTLRSGVQAWVYVLNHQ
jgi:gamma-glutamylcyclotransferase (GGCT)/AIG2-like uncharacterized protein YtfP